MKALVATHSTQGQRVTDVAECIDGELVYMLAPCENSIISPYGSCNCGRTFRGLFSDEVTTTAMVRELDGFTRNDLVLALRGYHDRIKNCGCTFPAAEDMADELLGYADAVPDGTVLERRLDWVHVRKPARQKRSR